MSVDERRTQISGGGWLATAGGALLLIALGFGVGIVAGTAYQEPELVAEHLAGRTTEVVLQPDGAAAASPDVAAAAPASLEREPAALGQSALADAPEAAEGPALEPEPPRAAVRPVPGSERPAAGLARTAARPAAKPAVAGSFSIQVGAFSSEKAARQLAGELGKQGYAAYLMDEGQGARWKVRIGPLRTRSEAEAVSAKLKREQRLPTWIQTNG